VEHFEFLERHDSLEEKLWLDAVLPVDKGDVTASLFAEL
jgi:hypothetical protein